MADTLTHASTKRMDGGPSIPRLGLLLRLTEREIRTRYRGSWFGIFWSVLTPLLMLAVFTFVFGTVFQSRWSNSSGPASSMEFAIILFIGLALFQLFSDIFTRAPSLIVSNSNYVKKVLFPLELLIPSIGLSAVFHASISIALLLPFIWFVFGPIPATAIFLPLIVAMLTLLALGLGWFLASIGTFVRDIGQAIGTITTALLFLSPIFFPLSSLPGWVRPLININPLTVPITEARKVLVFGEAPDFVALSIYFMVALLIAILGFVWFQRTRKGFADVL